jgi:class 3 adenylate cyclase
LKEFIDKETGKGTTMLDRSPIADLYACATIMFADIVGFTAWSSVREPGQVFSLLETVCHLYTFLAKRRHVVKVETVDACYVAVCRLPDPRRDHAVVMARFALDCQHERNDLTKLLEVKLGPGTGDVTVRIGLHSGPVTAGFLQGDKSRFQLFGGTVNTVGLNERIGVGNRIHLSQETANLISDSRKSHWVVKRQRNGATRFGRNADVLVGVEITVLCLEMWQHLQ